MAINQVALSNQINSLITKGIKSKYPDAQPGKHLKSFSRAIAYAFYKNLKKVKGKVVGPSGKGRPGKGIKGISVGPLNNRIKKEVVKQFGREGVALKYLSSGISEAIVKNLENATLKAGSAGPVKLFTGWNVGAMASDMLSLSGYEQTPENKKLFHAISKAIAEEISEKGSGSIPKAGKGGGSIVVSVS